MMEEIRRIDDLGRIHIPKELRELLGFKSGDPLKIYVNEDNSNMIIIEKYQLKDGE